MVQSEEIQRRIAAFAQLLAEEMGEIDESEISESGALSWLDAIETQAVEIGDAVQAEILKRKAAAGPCQCEAICPHCGQEGQYKRVRKRELIGRRGPVTIAEPEYYCPCCRKAFFPADQDDRR